MTLYDLEVSIEQIRTREGPFFVETQNYLFTKMTRGPNVHLPAKSRILEGNRPMFEKPEYVRDFLIGGKAVLTIKSLKTGKHFTYRITKKEQRGKDPIFFVGVLADGDNEGAFRYLGLLVFGPVGNRQGASLRLTAKSHAGVGAPSVGAMTYLLYNVFFHDRMPPDAEVYHEGKCCRCSRRLTHPISLVLGIGPECGALQHSLFAEAV